MKPRFWTKLKNTFEHFTGERFDESRALFTQFAKFGGVYYCISEYCIDVTTCIGPSMWPTFNHVGDVVLMDRTTNFFKKLKRGDVVVANSPTRKNGETVCKRIRALGGDIVIMPARGEPYFGEGAVQITVPPGHVWLEGDNPLNSSDSRSYGTVPVKMVRGRIFMKIWPSPQWVPNMPPHAEKDVFLEKLEQSGNPNWVRESIDRGNRRCLILYGKQDESAGSRMVEKPQQDPILNHIGEENMNQNSEHVNKPEGVPINQRVGDRINEGGSTELLSRQLDNLLPPPKEFDVREENKTQQREPTEPQFVK